MSRNRFLLFQKNISTVKISLRESCLKCIQVFLKSKNDFIDFQIPRVDPGVVNRDAMEIRTHLGMNFSSVEKQASAGMVCSKYLLEIKKECFPAFHFTRDQKETFQSKNDNFKLTVILVKCDSM
jgi:hypothetical protein